MGTNESKTFPGHDFDTFDGCVAAVGDDPAIDDPEGFCEWLEEEGKDALSDPNAQDVLATVGVEFVSAVDTPAQDSEWVIAKNEEGPDGETHRWQSETTLYVAKRDDGDEASKGDEKQIAFAPVLIPKEADKQGDVIPKPAIEDAAHRYLANHRKVDSDHDLRDGKGTPVESWTLKQDTTFEQPDGTESRTYPKGTWVMGIKFGDETWERVKSGELNGLSIYGGAKPVDVQSLLGKSFGGDPSNDADTEADTTTKNMTDDDTNPDGGDGGGGDGGVEQTTKQDLSADQVSTMLSAFAGMVDDGTVSRDASVEDFVRAILSGGSVNEGEVTGLSVFLGGDGGDGMETEADGSDGEDDDEGGDDDGGISMSDDGAGKSEDGDTDVDKNDDGGDGGDGDGDDVSKSVDADDVDNPVVAQIAGAVESLSKQVENLRDEVEGNAPRGGKMEREDELSDRLVKDITGVDDPDVARKAIREQVEKSTDDSTEVDYDGITDEENADASASGAAHSASANSRMVGGDN